MIIKNKLSNEINSCFACLSTILYDSHFERKYHGISHLHRSTLTTKDNKSKGYDLLAILTWNLCSKYFSLTAMLICPVITIFYIDLFGDYYLKMGKIGRWLAFPYLSCPFSVLQVSFIILGSKHPTLIWKCLRNYYVIFGGEPNLQG